MTCKAAGLRDSQSAKTQLPEVLTRKIGHGRTCDFEKLFISLSADNKYHQRKTTAKKTDSTELAAPENAIKQKLELRKPYCPHSFR